MQRAGKCSPWYCSLTKPPEEALQVTEGEDSEPEEESREEREGEVDGDEDRGTCGGGDGPDVRLPPPAELLLRDSEVPRQSASHNCHHLAAAMNFTSLTSTAPRAPAASSTPGGLMPPPATPLMPPPTPVATHSIATSTVRQTASSTSTASSATTTTTTTSSSSGGGGDEGLGRMLNLANATLDRAMNEISILPMPQSPSVFTQSVPPIMRDVHQLHTSLQKMMEKKASQPSLAPASDSRAKLCEIVSNQDRNLILSMEDRLNSAALNVQMEPVGIVGVIDIDAAETRWQKQVQEDTLKSVWMTGDDFLNTLYEGSVSEWATERRSLQEKWCTRAKTGTAYTSAPTSILSPSGVAITDPYQANLIAKANTYSNAITVISSREASILDNLQYMKQCVESFDSRDGNQVDLVDTWTLLCNLAATIPQTPKIPTPQTEAPNTRALFMEGSLTFLGQQFESFLESTVRASLPKAGLGGTPGFIARVEGFIRIRYEVLAKRGWPATWELHQGKPHWAILYYLLRCNKRTDATQFINQTAFDPIARKSLSQFISTGQVDAAQQQYFGDHFKTRDFLKKDPYKAVIYNLLSCHDTNHTSFTSVFSAQDYIWFKLNLVRNFNAHTDFTLPALQKETIKAFPALKKNILVGVQILIMCQLFDKAVSTLFEHDELFVETVHISLMMYLGKFISLPTVTGESQRGILDENVFPDSEGSWVNIPRLLNNYLNFIKLDIVPSLNYYSLVEAPYRFDCYSQLLIDSRNYQQLLGEGQTTGLLAHFVPNKQQLDHVISQAAMHFEQAGYPYDALYLWNKIRNYQSVIKVMANQLSKVLMSGASKEQREEALKKAQEVHNQLSRIHTNLPLWPVFTLLLNLGNFFYLCDKGLIHNALQALNEIQILPSSPQPTQIILLASKYQKMDHLVKRLMPDILRTTIDCLKKLWNLNHSAPDSNQVLQIKSWTAGLIAFCNATPDMPPQIRQQVVQLDTELM
ncbi:Nuclear pore complex protein Nup93 [Pelomyxa schiedti]|nr:Nuclear pore complex protein Nup93 [Pelomyxa schiedti]